MMSVFDDLWFVFVSLISIVGTGGQIYKLGSSWMQVMFAKCWRELIIGTERLGKLKIPGQNADGESAQMVMEMLAPHWQRGRNN